MTLQKKDHPELFKELQHWDWDKLDEEHRKGKSYYATLLFHIEDTDFDGKYTGSWMAHVEGEYEWGVHWEYTSELVKVKQIEKVSVVKEWVTVDTKEDNNLVAISKEDHERLLERSAKLEVLNARGLF